MCLEEPGRDSASHHRRLLLLGVHIPAVTFLWWKIMRVRESEREKILSGGGVGGMSAGESLYQEASSHVSALPGCGWPPPTPPAPPLPFLRHTSSSSSSPLGEAHPPSSLLSLLLPSPPLPSHLWQRSDCAVKKKERVAESIAHAAPPGTRATPADSAVWSAYSIASDFYIEK